MIQSDKTLSGDHSNDVPDTNFSKPARKEVYGFGSTTIARLVSFGQSILACLMPHELNCENTKLL